MKNLKKKLAIFATAALLSLGGSSILAMQGTERFNLKPAEEITNQTKFTKAIKWANRDFKEFESNFKEIEFLKKAELERVFYGAIAKEQLGLSVILYKDVNKQLGEEGNYVVGVSFCDPSFLPEEKLKYVAYDGHVINIDYEKFVKELEEIKYPDEKDVGDGRTFPITISIVDKVEGVKSDAIYAGVRYKNRETEKMEDLVYVIKTEGDKETGPLFKGYGNGPITLQDTDGDKLWH